MLLMQRRHNGEWQAPGGVLESDESFEEGVVREVLDETGLRVQVQHLTGVYKNALKSVIALVYQFQPIDGTFCTSDESAAVERFCVEDAASRMTPAFAVRVKDAVATGPAASRMQDGVEVYPPGLQGEDR